MKLKTIRTWTTRDGKRRFIRLYVCWNNLLQRTRGTSRHGTAGSWAGMPVGWHSFEAFRSWALANEYSKERCSLDRWDTNDGYTEENCQFLTVAENTARGNVMRKMSPERRAQEEQIIANAMSDD